MALTDSVAAVLFLIFTPAMFLMLAHAQLRKMSPAAVQRVNKFFRAAGMAWWWLSLAMAVFLAVQVKQHPELYALKTGQDSSAESFVLNTTGFVLPSGLASSAPQADFQKKLLGWQDKIDNAATYANVYRWLTGTVGWWLLLTYTLMAGRLRWALMRLHQHEPQPPQKPGILGKIISRIGKEEGQQKQQLPK